jgi:hypothetical protein
MKIAEDVARLAQLSHRQGDSLFEVRSLIWPDRSLNGTIFDIRSWRIYNRLVSLYSTFACAWFVTSDTICH